MCGCSQLRRKTCQRRFGKQRSERKKWESKLTFYFNIKIVLQTIFATLQSVMLWSETERKVFDKTSKNVDSSSANDVKSIRPNCHFLVLEIFTSSFGNFLVKFKINYELLVMSRLWPLLKFMFDVFVAFVTFVTFLTVV